MMFAGTKKCSPSTCSGRLRCRRDRVDVERRGVGRQQRFRLRDGVELSKTPRLTSRSSKTASTTTSAFDKFVPIVGESDRLRARPRLFLRQAPLLHLIHEHAHDGLARLLDGVVVGVHDRQPECRPARRRSRCRCPSCPRRRRPRARSPPALQAARRESWTVRVRRRRGGATPATAPNARARRRVALRARCRSRTAARPRPAPRRSACGRRIRRFSRTAPSCAPARRRTDRPAPERRARSLRAAPRRVASRPGLASAAARSHDVALDDFVEDPQLERAFGASRSNP